MCRNFRTLFNFEPPATHAEIRDASLQVVRKLSGFTAKERSAMRYRRVGSEGQDRG